MPQRQTLAEARPTLVAEATGTPGRYLVQLINPGWGSSGYYSPGVLAEAATAKVFPAGLHMYADHPTATESVERPERSVTDLWGVLASDATVSADGALVAEAQVFAPYRPLLDEMRDAIGLSIRAYGLTDVGEAEGRQGQIITSLEQAASVDFVTAAGRGGKILELLESARTALREARNIGNWIESRMHLTLTTLGDEMFGDGRLTREERIALSGAVGDGLTAFTASLEQTAPQLYQRDLYDSPPETQTAMSEAELLAEATANDTREALQTEIGEEYGADPDVYAWVRDFDPDAAVVYFDISGATENTGTYRQGYTVAPDGSVELAGDRVEVTVRTTYVPVTAPDPDAGGTGESHVPVSPAGSTPTTESLGGTMPEIEEARLRQLEEAHGRVPTLESERDTAVSRAETAEAALAERDRRDAARPVIAEAFAGSTVPATTVTRVTEALLGADVPATTDGQLDEAAMRTRATEARTAAEAEIAEALAAAGVGAVRGFGTTPAGEGAELTEAEYDRRSGATFGRQTAKGA